MFVQRMFVVDKIKLKHCFKLLIITLITNFKPFSLKRHTSFLYISQLKSEKAIVIFKKNFSSKRLKI